MFAKFSQIFASIPTSPTLVWVYLGIACLFEVAWTLSLKFTNGFSHVGWTLASIPISLFSTGFLALAMKTMPMGTAYAIWTSIGTVGTVTLGVLFFHEKADMVRLVCMALILIGVLGLKLTET